MWKKNYLDDNLLFITTGMKKTKTGILRKVSGPSAKYFANNNCGYIYISFSENSQDNSR